MTQSPLALLSSTLSWSLLLVVLLGGCATEFPGDPPDVSRLEHPVAIAIHPDGRYLYVVSANFDLRYRLQDGGLLSVIDTETGEILTDRTLRIPSFSADIELNHDASRGYFAARGGSAVYWFDISDDGGTLSCPLGDGGDQIESCRIRVPSEPTSIAYSRQQRSQTLLDTDGTPLLDANGDPQTEDVVFDLLMVAHLSDGVVSAITAIDPLEGAIEPTFSVNSASVIEAPSDVINQPGTDRFWVTGRASNQLLAVRPAISTDGKVIGLFQDTALTVPTAFTYFEGRSMLFSPDGDRLYVSNHLPNSLLVFDFSEGDDDEVSGSRNRIIETFDVPMEPNSMSWVDVPGGSPLLYVSHFDSDSLSIIDPSVSAVIGRLPLGDGPFQIVQSAANQRLYVNNFTEHTVSVVSIEDPRNPEEISYISGSGDRSAADALRAILFR